MQYALYIYYEHGKGHILSVLIKSIAFKIVLFQNLKALIIRYHLRSVSSKKKYGYALCQHICCNRFISVNKTLIVLYSSRRQSSVPGDRLLPTSGWLQPFFRLRSWSKLRYCRHASDAMSFRSGVGWRPEAVRCHVDHVSVDARRRQRRHLPADGNRRRRRLATGGHRFRDAGREFRRRRERPTEEGNQIRFRILRIRWSRYWNQPDGRRSGTNRWWRSTVMGTVREEIIKAT